MIAIQLKMPPSLLEWLDRASADSFGTSRMELIRQFIVDGLQDRGVPKPKGKK